MSLKTIVCDIHSIAASISLYARFNLLLLHALVLTFLFFLQDFLAILSKVSRGSVQEKLHWIFGLYDLNKDGVITKKEMQDVVHSIYSMLGRHTDPQTDDQSAKDHVDRIFHVSHIKKPL